MLQNLLTKKLNRQTRTAGKAQITTKEALLVEHVTAAVEHILLVTQHVVDPNATLRLTRWKRTALLALPVPDLHTMPAPVLTPSVSKEHADEDTEGAKDAKVKLTYKLIILKQSRSLTCRIVNL